MPIRSLTILCHAHQPLRPGAYAALLAERWRQQGRTIHVHHGLSSPPPADAALLHVDLTRVPAEYAALLERYPIRLNEQPLDISKRNISRALLTREDPYAGPVLVKTDLNSTGRPERDLARARGLRARLWASVRRRLPLRFTGAVREYQRYEHIGDVPSWVWATPDLVVERFFEQRDAGHWVINQWFVLGEHGLVSTMRASGPIVKLANRVDYLPLTPEVPPEVQARRRELGIDYAKIDYIVHDGVGQVIDVNRTPDQGPDYNVPRVHDLIDVLLHGLDDFGQVPRTPREDRSVSEP